MGWCAPKCELCVTQWDPGCAQPQIHLGPQLRETPQPSMASRICPEWELWAPPSCFLLALNARGHC